MELTLCITDQVEVNGVNPLRMVDGYRSSLRDATGPVYMYSAYVSLCMYMCTCTHALCINIAY